MPLHPQGIPLGAMQGVLEDHWHRLSPASRRLRFMTNSSNRSLSALASRSKPDLVLKIEVDGTVRGTLEAYMLQDHHAEIGLSVEDDFQGMGLGSALFRSGLKDLRRMGILTVDMFFSAQNAGVVHLVRAAGGQIRQSGPECTARIRLTSV